MPQSAWALFPFHVAPHRSPRLVGSIGFQSAREPFTRPGRSAMVTPSQTSLHPLAIQPSPSVLPTHRGYPLIGHIAPHQGNPWPAAPSWRVCMDPSHPSTCKTSPHAAATQQW